jgi:hypothetical protein
MTPVPEGIRMTNIPLKKRTIKIPIGKDGKKEETVSFYDPWGNGHQPYLGVQLMMTYGALTRENQKKAVAYLFMLYGEQGQEKIAASTKAAATRREKKDKEDTSREGQTNGNNKKRDRTTDMRKKEITNKRRKKEKYLSSYSSSDETEKANPPNKEISHTGGKKLGDLINAGLLQTQPPPNMEESTLDFGEENVDLSQISSQVH